MSDAAEPDRASASGAVTAGEPPLPDAVGSTTAGLDAPPSTPDGAPQPTAAAPEGHGVVLTRSTVVSLDASATAAPDPDPASAKEPSSSPTAVPEGATPASEAASPERAAAQPASPAAPVEPSRRRVDVRVFGRTDVGMVREHNEDNFLIADLTQRLRSVKPEVRSHTIGERGSLFAVCDGMGGAAAGEVASQMAVDTVHELLQAASVPTSRDAFARRISEAISEAGARIYLAAKTNRAQRGMGTTSTVAGVFDGTLFLGQVGDSRAYLVRGGRIKQLTRDQSLVAKLIEAGQLTEEEAENYEHGHIILQALGTSDTVDVDLSFLDLRQGDALLLCSDGLCGLVTSAQMLEVLTTSDEPMDCCKRLTDLANAAGGHDNITVIIARFGGDIPLATEAEMTFGYQPWVLAELPPEERDERVPSQIKGADAPPPGKDVKNATSLRPPAMGAAAAMRAGGHDGDDDDLKPPITKSPPYAAALLIGLSLGLIVAAVYLLR